MEHLYEALLSYFDYKFALDNPPQAYQKLSHEEQVHMRDWLEEYFMSGVSLGRIYLKLTKEEI